MPVRLLPAVEKVTTAYLRASGDVAAIAGDRVGAHLYAGTQSLVWLSHVTGDERFRNYLAAQMVDIRSYGGTKEDAELLARTVHAVMHDMPGTHAGGVVTAVRCLAMPAWNPDEGFTPARARYVGTYEITLHPLPA